MPIMTFANSREDAHIHILGKTGFLYKTKEKALQIISDFVANGIPNKGSSSYNVYSSYEPVPVMKRFHEVFIDPCIKKLNLTVDTSMKTLGK